MNFFKKYFYKQIAQYLTLYIRPSDTYVIVNSDNEYILQQIPNGKSISIIANHPTNIIEADYVVVCGNLHNEDDIQDFLQTLQQACQLSTRILIVYYSSLWKPFMKLASVFGIRKEPAHFNWVGHEDLDNFFRITDLETVRRESKIICPIYIPLLSWFLNRFIAPLPLFNIFSMINIEVARKAVFQSDLQSVSIIVPARNEEGNIENIVNRIPKMSDDDEIIFIEGNSTDNTWSKIQEIAQKYGHEKQILLAKQPGKGKFDAVKLGFEMATKDILMILDADITVPAEDLPRFYKAIKANKGEFINGSRLVYPMEKQAMRFFNIIGNKFFALGFSFVLGQSFKDTLCGTKVFSRKNYQKMKSNRAYFGDFDPFGDFDMILGAARMGLKIVEIPIHYKDRTYGETNISRWKHGVILLRMLTFASFKIKFI